MATFTNSELIKRLGILIADGKPYTRALLRSMLLQLGIKSIHEVGDGAAVIEAVFNLNPDIMIMDWDLPVLNAQDVLRMARSPGGLPNPNLPIIVVSNSGESAYVNEAFKLGIQHFLVRPISPKKLGQRLLGIVVASRKAAPGGKRNILPPRREALLV